MPTSTDRHIGVIDSIQRGWSLFRTNLVTWLVVPLIIYAVAAALFVFTGVIGSATTDTGVGLSAALVVIAVFVMMIIYAAGILALSIQEARGNKQSWSKDLFTHKTGRALLVMMIFSIAIGAASFIFFFVVGALVALVFASASNGADPGGSMMGIVALTIVSIIVVIALYPVLSMLLYSFADPRAPQHTSRGGRAWTITKKYYPVILGLIIVMSIITFILSFTVVLVPVLEVISSLAMAVLYTRCAREVDHDEDLLGAESIQSADLSVGSETDVEIINEDNVDPSRPAYRPYEER